MRIGVGTIQRGRATALARHVRAVAGLRDCARHVVVSMDAMAPELPGTDVVHLPVGDGVPLPLAAARNRAMSALADLDLIVMLDVDCLADPALLVRYADAAAHDPAGLFIGPVAYLDPLPEQRCPPTAAQLRAARDRPTKRPFPAAGVARAAWYELFWSLSFALTPATAQRIGGFDEAYRGYGAEDTDYALRARAAGVELSMVAGAWAYHQHHGSRTPPTEHLASIAVNARRFRARWGVWPMSGWLEQFAREGLVEWEPDGERLALTGSAGGQPQPPR